MSNAIRVDFLYTRISEEDGVETGGCGCCADYPALTDELLQEAIEDTRKNLDLLIELREKRKSEPTINLDRN